MNKMIKDRPIKPEEVRARRIDFIPSIIFETINTMICEKFDGKYATLKQEDILNRICNESSGLTRQEIFDKHYLDRRKMQEVDELDGLHVNSRIDAKAGNIYNVKLVRREVRAIKKSIEKPKRKNGN